MNALQYAAQLLDLIPRLIAAGQDVTAALAEGRAAIATMQAEGRDPTPAEWDALNGRIKALRDELHG